LESDFGSSEFSGSTISWNWPGWKLAERGGRTYFFPDGGNVERPEQSALLAIENRQGDRLILPRDSAGNLIRARSPDGTELDFQYDSRDRITQIRDRAGAQFDYSYDPGGRLVKVRDAIGQVTEYSYDESSRMTNVIQNGVLILRNQYGAGDRVVRQILPGGRTYTFKYPVDHTGQSVAADVFDSAGLTWKISMTSGTQYTFQSTRRP
jgi:YD repeat-containing protein